MAFTVFVSYSAPDRELVQAIRDAAAPLQIKIYSYDQDLQPGSSLPDKLLKAIDASDAVVVLLTHAGANSPAVNQEIGAARLADKTVIPVIEAGVDPSRFTFLQGLEYQVLNRDNPTDTLLRLSTRLAALKGKKDNSNFWVLMLLIAAVVIFAGRE